MTANTTTQQDNTTTQTNITTQNSNNISEQKVMNLLLQVLEDGRLTDGKARGLRAAETLKHMLHCVVAE